MFPHETWLLYVSDNAQIKRNTQIKKEWLTIVWYQRAGVMTEPEPEHWISSEGTMIVSHLRLIQFIEPSTFCSKFNTPYNQSVRKLRN